jgi:hypothetical protein
VLVGIVMDRDALNARIDERMEAIAAAAGDEVRAARREPKELAEQVAELLQQ